MPTRNNTNRGLFPRTAIACAIASLATGLPTWAQAADIEMVPLPGAAFSVKSTDGKDVRLKVKETGEVIIPNLPTEMAGKPLCWDSMTGVLRKCPDAAGTDFIPPTIVVDAPAVANQNSIPITATYADNVELAYRLWSSTASSFPSPVMFDSGQKSAAVSSTLEAALGVETSRTIMAVDTSGNASKATVKIASPTTAFKLGDYNIISGSPLPANFSCGDDPFLNGAPLRAASMLFASAWSVAAGFTPQLAIVPLTIPIPPSSGVCSTSPSAGCVRALAPIPLDATSFSFEDSVLISSRPAYKGVVNIVSTSPLRLQIEMQMKCGYAGSATTYGDKATFTIELVP